MQVAGECSEEYYSDDDDGPPASLSGVRDLFWTACCCCSAATVLYRDASSKRITLTVRIEDCTGLTAFETGG